MAKKLVYNYTFNPGASEVGNIQIPGYVELSRFLLVTNTTTNTIIYNFASSGLGGTASYNATTNVTTLTFQTNTSSMSASHKLQIYIDEYYNEQKISPNLTYQDPVEKMRV